MSGANADVGYTRMEDHEVKATAKQLAAQALERTQPVQKPTAVLTGGQQGSGKSRTIVAQAMRELGPANTVLIDPDKLREDIPRIKALMTGDRDWLPPDAWRDAQRVARELVTEMKGTGRNIVSDGTLADPDRTPGRIKELKDAGLRVEVRGAAVYADVSRARTFERREIDFEKTRNPETKEYPTVKTGFGRRVDPRFHDGTAKDYVATIEKLQNTPSVGVDRIAIYDREGTLKLDLNNEGKKFVAQPIPQNQEPTAGAQAKTTKSIPPLQMTDAARLIEATQRTPTTEDLRLAVRTYLTVERSMEARKAPARDYVEIRPLKDAALDRANANAAVRVALLKDDGLERQKLREMRDAKGQEPEKPLKDLRIAHELAGRAWRANPATAQEMYPQYKRVMQISTELVSSSIAAAQQSGMRNPAKLEELRARVVEKLGSDIAKGVPPLQNFTKGATPIRVATSETAQVKPPPEVRPPPPVTPTPPVKAPTIAPLTIRPPTRGR